MEIQYINKEVKIQTLAGIEEGVPFRIDRYSDPDPAKRSFFDKVPSNIYEEAIFMKVKSPSDVRGFNIFYVVNVINGIFYLYTQTGDFYSYNEDVDVEEILFPANLHVIPVKATLVVER